MISRKLSRFVAASLFLAAGAVLGHADPVVYDQPYSVGAYYTWASYTAPSGNVATGYDTFALTAAANVTAVQWHGNYLASTEQGGNPVSAGTTAFTISFLADNNGSPGATLSTATVDMASCAPQSLGTEGFQYVQNGAVYQIPFYAYRAVLPTPFAAAAGQNYWISIVGQTNSDGINWSWYSSGDGSDGTSIQNYQGNQTRPFNRNFTLEGTSATATVPTVSAAATVSKTTTGSGAPGVVTLTLSAPAPAKLTVKYTLGGTGINGTDYQALNGKVKFAAGQSSADVQIVPEGDLGGASKKTVLLTLTPSGKYTVGTTKAAKVKITKSTVIILP